MNYYQILGIENTASTTAIKDAYRKLAMKYHPDRNQGRKDAEEKFKIILEAYNILSDENKKKEYDSTLYKSSQTFKKSQSSQETAQPQIFQVTLGFWEAIFGIEKEIPIFSRRIIKVKFPPGTADETTFGIQIENYELIIQVRVLGDEKFQRDNLDLYCDIEIQFSTAALGGKIIFPHWKGEVEVMVPAGTQYDDYLTIPNGGIDKNPFIGDMYLRCKITVPTKMTKQQTEILQQFRNIEQSTPNFISSLKEHWKRYFR